MPASRFFGVLIGLIGVGPCMGKLAWRETEVTATAAPTDKKFAAAFRFVNEGPQPVSIVSLQADCDCVSATSDKPQYSSGEGGAINVTVEIGEQHGVLRKTVYVATTETPTIATKLRIHLMVPEVATVSPRVILWDPGNPTFKPFFAVKLGPVSESKIADVITDTPKLRVVTVTDEDGDARIELRPSKDLDPGAYTVTVKISTPGGLVDYLATFIFRR